MREKNIATHAFCKRDRKWLKAFYYVHISGYPSV
jgi:hypothetical protein